jgi:[ribosomal protein S5]-alanine N-acetyltransferase
MSFVWKLATTDRDASGQYFIPDAALSAVRYEPAPVCDDWRQRVPELSGARVTLRELRADDAMALFSAVANPEVTRFISPPPATVEGFEQFIAWAQRQRAEGQGLAYGIVPHGSDAAIGLFQMRALQQGFANAEWGFLIASEFWGSGMFVDSARLMLAFAFGVIGVRRLEARAASGNGRGNAALGKLGAVREGMLRKSFLRHGEVLDQAMWTVLADEWGSARQPIISSVIH